MVLARRIVIRQFDRYVCKFRVDKFNKSIMYTSCDNFTVCWPYETQGVDFTQPCSAFIISMKLKFRCLNNDAENYPSSTPIYW